MPDATTEEAEGNRETGGQASRCAKFRHLLERHDLGRRIFAEVGALLEDKMLLMREGTLIDASIIAAPSSTKNLRRERDPEPERSGDSRPNSPFSTSRQMHQTKKGNQWHFGMKAHIGADEASGLVHSVEGTAANVSDISQARALLHGGEKRAGADAGYVVAEPGTAAWKSAPRSPPSDARSNGGWPRGAARTSGSPKAGPKPSAARGRNSRPGRERWSSTRSTL